MQGGVFKIETAGGLKITDGRNRVANITATDVAASNGVIHVIDKVILPADKDIVATAQSLPDFSILVEAVVAAGLVSTLQGAGPFTVFAPTNAAFAALLTELGVSKDALLANKPLLTKVLTYHVVPGRVLKADVPVGPAIATVQGETFTVNSSLKITDRRGRLAGIAATDVFREQRRDPRGRQSHPARCLRDHRPASPADRPAPRDACGLAPWRPGPGRPWGYTCAIDHPTGAPP